jgi:hypothetical protein
MCPTTQASWRPAGVAGNEAAGPTGCGEACRVDEAGVEDAAVEDAAVVEGL